MANVTNKPKLQEMFITPTKILVGDGTKWTNIYWYIPLQKSLEYESDRNGDEYEVPILKYDANQDALVEQKKGTLVEEEELKTPSQSTFEEGKDIESKDDESYAPCSQLTINLWNGEEGGSPSYVHNHKHRYK
jgi:hypothetical protein